MMNDKRKKIIGAGILAICIASMVHASNERESPSVGWMLALCSTWSLGVWLWPGMNWPILSIVRSWPWRKVISSAIIMGLLCVSVVLGTKIATEKWHIDSERIKLQQEHASAIEFAQAAAWYVQPAQKVYAELIALREWKDGFKKICQKAIFDTGEKSRIDIYNKWSMDVKKEEEKIPKQVEAFLRLPLNETASFSYEEVVRSYRVSQDPYYRGKE